MPQQSQWKSEAEFQAACVKWFDREMAHHRGRLIAIYNNPPNISQLISMGLRPGASDLFYRLPNKLVVWIELKLIGRTQNLNQIIFEQMVTAWGDPYHLVTEHLDAFINVIKIYNDYGK